MDEVIHRQGPSDEIVEVHSVDKAVPSGVVHLAVSPASVKAEQEQLELFAQTRYSPELIAAVSVESGVTLMKEDSHGKHRTMLQKSINKASKLSCSVPTLGAVAVELIHHHGPTDEFIEVHAVAEAPTMVTLEPKLGYKEVSDNTVQSAEDKEILEVLMKEEHVPLVEIVAVEPIRHMVGIHDDYVTIVAQQDGLDAKRDASLTHERPIEFTEHELESDIAVVSTVRGTEERTEEPSLLETPVLAEKEKLEIESVSRYSPDLIETPDVQTEAMAEPTTS